MSVCGQSLTLIMVLAICVTTIITGSHSTCGKPGDCSNSSPPTELTSGRTADCECNVYECTPKDATFFGYS